MGEGPRFRVAFRRRREGKTDYKKRLGLVKSGKPRLVVRRSSRTITVQFIDFGEQGDVVRAAATSRDLVAQGWTHSGSATPAAYLTGLLAAKRAKKAGIEEAVLDIGRQDPTPGGRIFAALKGVVDGGIDVPHDEEILPDEKRLQGEHIKDAPIAMFKKVQATIQGGPA
ncbi:MAG TPA: 50S ribosomal protein L18 [Candidatus Thermoplasmatota archaeon]|nr:50S ribosomal protein L18 [Candidatus Thermoplasmatota archaeon]